MQVEFEGRLGNQMFIYAFMKELEHKYLCDVKADLQNYKNNEFELTKVFDIDINKVKNIERKRIKYLPYKLSSLIGVNRWIYLTDIIDESSIDSANIKENSYFKGFWQGEYYFNDITNEIKKIFVNKKQLNIKSIGVEKEMLNNNSVSVHVRRGDYLSNHNKDYFISLSNTKYYTNAIKAANSNDATFYFFSDDIEWCKKEFNELNAVFIDWNKAEDSWQDMILMSKCKTNIIANSSFSWWGAYLCDKRVFAPNKFYYNEQHADRRCPKRWNIISI